MSGRDALHGRQKKVTLSRGPCYGSCPIYVVTLRADGIAEWHGEQNVEPLSDFHGQFSMAEFTHLVEVIAGTGFFDLPDQFLPSGTDLPDYRIQVDLGREPKEVLWWGDEEPLACWTIATLIDGVVAHIEWGTGPGSGHKANPTAHEDWPSHEADG
jgi:Domain of unknown function (DUF6438)